MTQHTHAKKPHQPRKTKIVATLGPNSSDEKTLIAMLKAGMNIARLNFSHGDHEEQGGKIEAVRNASHTAKKPVAILQDLAGPKIRIGDFSTDTVTLKRGQTFTLTTKKVVGTDKLVHINYQKLPKEVKKGGTILINDGKLSLTVTKTTPTDVVCKVVIGGTIRGRRGVNVPGANLSINTITAKDKKDLAFGLSIGVNFVTLSFVRRAKDIHQLRKLIGKHADEIGIVAKIETQEAIDNIDDIIAASDAIMVARGDLAIEVPRAKVPLLQKEIIMKCNYAGKPVITATQMLDSMRENEVPTRAEVNDVANAILDGSDAVMLSDETTIGTFPEKAVATMADIADTIEAEMSCDPLYINHDDVKSESKIGTSVTTAIANEACELDVAAIVALSESGRTARLIARHRPHQTIYLLTPHVDTFHKALLIHGCEPILIEPVTSLDDAVEEARTVLKDHKAAQKGDLFILGAGKPFRQHGSTNMMVIERM